MIFPAFATAIVSEGDLMLGGLAAPSHKITPADINSSRETFEASETRDLFYRAATELVPLEVSSRFVIFCTVDCTYRERPLGARFS
jgi:hypothetical protein